MTTDLERYDPKTTIALAPDAWGLAQKIAPTTFVPGALRNNAEGVLACILTGSEIGIGPMHSLRQIYVVDGRPAMAAELMRALVLRDGHELWIEESNSTRCKMGAKRVGSTRETRFEWTLDDAERAGLKGKDNWRKYPAAMLLARCTAAICRAVFPDVIAGISYTVEELDDGDLFAGELEPPPDGSAAPPAAKTTKARAKRTATRGAAPAAPEAASPPPTRKEPPLPGEEDDETGPGEPESGSGDDDDVIDAEIVDGPGEGATGPETDDYEGPDQHLSEPKYRGTQLIAIRAGERGLDRDAKIELASRIAGRVLTSTAELDPAEVSLVLDVLSDDDEFAKWAAPRTRPRSAAPPAPPSGRSPNADEWSADDWRAFLRERGVKVAEVIREAGKLAKELDVPAVTTLDGFKGSELAAGMVGFVEDLAAERGGS